MFLIIFSTVVSWTCIFFPRFYQCDSLSSVGNFERNNKMTTLTVGYGEKKITPRLGIDLTGYGFYLDRRAESILDDLKVRVLFLQQEQNSIILISCDLLGFTVEFSDSIRQEIALAHKIPPQNILLACIHTHSGPASQPLPGLGKVDTNYMAFVKKAIKEAVELAAANSDNAEFAFAFEAIEPIGFNRREANFKDIDPLLKVAVFKQKDRKIYLVSYACHPVTLGRTTDVSADWPGALIQEIEDKGNQGIFFQGFCGDIDPVTNMNRWGSGTKEDLLLYGKMLFHRTLKTETHLVFQEKTTLKALEKRIHLPLKVCSKDEIEQQAESFLESNKQFPLADRFIDEWKTKAYQKHAELSEKPFLENIPIQVISIGQLKILGLPGEVFCRIGLNLQKRWHPLFTFGYANGNIGYIPTQSAYQDAADYACYCAPKFYSVFQFSQEIEKILVRESAELLADISIGYYNF